MTFIPVIAVSQCLKLQVAEIFINHAFTDIVDILGTETAELGKTDDIPISFSWIQLTE